MANARLAALLARRQGTPYSSSGRIRLLTPANNSIAAIAKKTVTSELSIMQANYNSGQVSNSDFKDFLVKMLNTPGVSETDKNDIQTQIKDFDSRIVGDKLEQAYKAAPDNTLQQVQAAQAMATYFRQRAATMQPDTPAYNDNINNASAYDQKVTQINDNVQKIARQNKRYILEQQVNKIPSGTSDNASAKAEMWKNLYTQAVADGDTTAANQYAANYQQEVTNADNLSTKETTKAEETDLRNILGTLQNDYHDGKINEQDYLQALSEISPRIDATNNYGLINTLNRTSDIIQKNLDKGGLNRGTTASGLPVVLGKNKGGGGIVTDWDQQDFDYSDSLRKLQDGLRKGTISTADYQKNLALVVEQRVKDLEAQTAAVDAIAQENPNAKVMYNGKKTRASDVLDSLATEYSNLETQAGAIVHGDPKNLALVMVAPKEFNKAGDVTKTGKSFSTYELVDTTNLPKDEYLKDSEGVYHPILQIERPLTVEEQANVYNNTYTDPNGKTYRVRTDSSTGNQYLITGEQYAKVYKPFSSESINVAPDKNGEIPDYTSALALKTQTETSQKLKPQFDKFREQVAKQDAITQVKIDQQNQPVEKIKQFAANVPNLVKPVTQPIANVVDKATQAVDSALLPKTVAPIAPKKPEDLGVTPSMQVKLPDVRVQQPTQNAYQPIKLPELKLAGAKPATTIPLPAGQQPKPIPAPNVPSNIGQQVKQAQQRDLSITGSLKQLAKNFGLGGLFGIK